MSVFHIPKVLLVSFPPKNWHLSKLAAEFLAFVSSTSLICPKSVTNPKSNGDLSLDEGNAFRQKVALY